MVHAVHFIDKSAIEVIVNTKLSLSTNSEKWTYQNLDDISM